MRVLITGSSGLIGRNLCNILNNTEHEVMLVDKKTGFNLAYNKLDKIIEFSPEVIYHLAASFERTEESFEFIKVNYEDNVLASVRLNQIIPMLKDLECYVFASSYLVYDPKIYMSPEPRNYQENCGIQEFYQLNPRNLCGASKLYTEKELYFLSHFMPQVRFISARIFRVYGEGCNSFVSKCVRAGLSGDPVSVWNIENKFDYIHAKDVAEGLHSLALSHAKGIFNLSYGVPRSISDVLALSGAGYSHAVRDEYYETSYADLRKIERETGWKAKISLEEGIERLIQHEKSHPNH